MHQDLEKMGRKRGSTLQMAEFDSMIMSRCIALILAGKASGGYNNFAS